MKTKTINLYEYKELSKESQGKVIEYFRKGNEYSQLEEYMEESIVSLLKDNGIVETGDTKINYSLSYCQGDGAMFYGFFKWKGYNVTIKQAGRYSHYNSKDINITDNEGESIPNTVFYAKQPVDEAFNEVYVSICKKLEKYGYACIEAEDSEERIVETIEANEYLFTEEGRIESLT